MSVDVETSSDANMEKDTATPRNEMKKFYSHIVLLILFRGGKRNR